MNVRLSDVIAKPFWKLHNDIKRHGHTYYWCKGGRGSTKSSFISLEIPMLLIKNPQMHAVVLRKVAANLRTSVFPQIQWGIETLGLSKYFKAITSPLEITYRLTGQKILFFGVDDPTKIKSIKLPFGYIGVVWYEELDQFSGMEELRNLNQSFLRGGEKYWEFCSFNPPKSRDNWVNTEQAENDSDRYIHSSTYLDVPRDWLGERFILEAEKLKAKNEKLYEHEYLGEVTGTGGSVFENVEERKFSAADLEQFDRRHFGLDFGFAVDPLAFVAMHYDAKREELYIFDEIYKQQLKNKPAAEMMLQKAGRSLIIADSAEPRTIATMHDYGLNIHGAKKGADSVDHGIKWLQERRKIYIDKERCPNTYREFIGYEYARNKDGQFISAYPDKNNHAIDAVRYACESLARRKNYSF